MFNLLCSLHPIYKKKSNLLLNVSRFGTIQQQIFFMYKSSFQFSTKTNGEFYYIKNYLGILCISILIKIKFVVCDIVYTIFSSFIKKSFFIMMSNYKQ